MSVEKFKEGDTVYFKYTNRPMVLLYESNNIVCVAFTNNNGETVQDRVPTTSITKTPYTPPQNTQSNSPLNGSEYALVAEFAKYALQGLLANPKIFDGCATIEYTATYARKLAEAMVKELKNPT